MTAPIPPTEAAAAAPRLEHLLARLLPAIWAFALLLSAAAIGLRSVVVGLLAAACWGYLGLARTARARLDRGEPAAAASLLSYGLLAAALFAVAVEPALYPALAFVPLLAVGLSFPHRARRSVRRLAFRSWVVTVLVIVTGELLHPDAQGWFPGLRAGSLAAAASLAFLVLWQLSRRLTDALAKSESGNLELQSALAEVRRAEEQVRTLAYHDPLTGLPNRLLFGDRLSMAVSQAQRLGTGLAVLFLDLDRFKVINDALGHAAGDQLLRLAAERLTTNVRAGDTVARMSGDEFVVLLPGAGRRAAIRVSEKIRDSLRPAFAVGGYELVATASIGISLFPEHGTSADALLKSADVAMYHAKLQGRDHHRLYVTAMDAGAAESLALEGALRRALESEALTLHYQPIVEVASGRIRAVEALIRWRHPQLGLVWPADFIPLAEVAGLIHPISSWVLRTVCQQAKAWHLNGHPDLVITVNLSARQFHKPDLASLVADILREAGLPPRFLELEITESYAVQDAPSALATLQELKRLGVRIAIDDFGAGYTSLAYLKRFPIDTLKIDGSLLREVDSDRKDAAVAAALISMAHNLGLQVVAEGIETEDQRAFLQAQGCDCIQGFLYSHPLPAEECEALLEENLHENRGPKDPQHTLAWSHR